MEYSNTGPMKTDYSELLEAYTGVILKIFTRGELGWPNGVRKFLTGAMFPEFELSFDNLIGLGKSNCKDDGIEWILLCVINALEKEERLWMINYQRKACRLWSSLATCQKIFIFYSHGGKST